MCNYKTSHVHLTVQKCLLLAIASQGEVLNIAGSRACTDVNGSSRYRRPKARELLDPFIVG